MATPIQAVLPRYSTPLDELKAITQAKPCSINEPRIIQLTGGSDLIFDARAGAALGDRKVVSKLLVHNLGANPMYYGINQLATTLLNGFHDILAGGSVVKDGLGSQVDLSKDQPTFVSVKGTAGEWVAVVISYPLGTFLD